VIFESMREWLGRRQVLRDFAELQRAERDRDDVNFKEVLERAEAAVAADQRETALHLWQEIRSSFRRQAIESQKILRILLYLQQFDDAEQLMNDGLARHPGERFFLVGHARVAEQRGDIEIALKRWAVVRKKFPLFALGYAQSAACLTRAGRMVEADKMLARGIRLSPGDVFCLIEHAKLAEAMGDFQEALVRWRRLMDFPSDQHIFRQNGAIGLAQCQRKMGHPDEAEAVLVPFVERFGLQEITAMELARIAEDRGDLATALARWQRVKRIFPMLDQGYRGVIQVLKKIGEKDGVDTILCEMIERFPDDVRPAADYARNAAEQRDKPETARRWAMVVERFPECESAYRHAGDALDAIGQADAAAAIRADHKARFIV
jgi:tetratricopeptide (TPR) repeat protein